MGRATLYSNEYDNENRRHMEYVHDYGAVADFPYDMVYHDVFDQKYPGIEKLIREQG